MTESNPSPSSGVLSQGLISMAAYGVNSVASFFAVIGMIRLLGRDDWGLFALAIQIIAFTSMIADFGIGPVIMRRLAIAPGRAASIVLEATTSRLLLLVPTWIVSLLVGWWLAPGWEFFLLLNLMLVNLVISAKVPVLRGTLESFYRSQSRMALPTVTTAVDALMLLAMVLVVPASFHDPVRAMVLYTASNLLGALWLGVAGWRFIRRLNTESVRVTVPGMRELLATSAPLAVFLILNALHITIDSIYLKHFHGDAAVGLFNAALRIMTPLSIFPAIITISAAPYFARASVAEDDEQRARMSRLFSLSVKTLLIGSVLLSGFGVTNAKLLLHAAFGGKFDDAALPMMLLFALFLPMSLNIFLVELNNARGRLRENTRFAAILAAVSCVSGVFLISAHAAPGAAVAKFLAILAGLAFLIFHSREGIAVAMKPLAAKSALLLIAIVGVRLLLDAQHWLLSNTAALLAFLVALILLRVYSADELAQWRAQFASLLRRTPGGTA